MEIDRENATGRPDRDAIDATAAARQALVDRIRGGLLDNDLLHAAAMLGRLLAALGASPSLAAATIDGVVRALETPGPSKWAGSGKWEGPARSALCEAYVAAREELAKIEATKSWSFPACCVPLSDGTVAVAAGIPSDDSDDIVTWADGVARALARMKVRRVIIGGKKSAALALEDALSLVGIDADRSPGFGVT